MGKFERRVTCLPSYSGEQEGIGAMRIQFALIGPAGAVSWMIGTNWYCAAAQDHLNVQPGDLVDSLTNMLGGNRYQPQAWDLGVHSRAPMYDGQQAHSSCYLLGDAPCYYDGSTLNAEPVIPIFLEQGDEGVWEYLERYYYATFADIDPPIPTPEPVRRRTRPLGVEE